MLRPDFIIPTIESSVSPMIGLPNVQPISKNFPFALTEREISGLNMGRFAIVSAGTVSYRTEFKKLKSEPICWVYWSNWSSDKRGDVSRDGGYSMTCQDFEAMRSQIPNMIEARKSGQHAQ